MSADRTWSTHARDLLASWQKAEWARLGTAPVGESQFQELASRLAGLSGHPPNTEGHAAAAAEILARLREAQSRVPTPYESASWYGVATSLVTEVEEAIRARSPGHVQPLFGSIPSGMVDARTVYLPETEPADGACRRDRRSHGRARHDGAVRTRG